MTSLEPSKLPNYSCNAVAGDDVEDGYDMSDVVSLHTCLHGSDSNYGYIDRGQTNELIVSLLLYYTDNDCTQSNPAIT